MGRRPVSSQDGGSPRPSLRWGGEVKARQGGAWGGEGGERHRHHDWTSKEWWWWWVEEWEPEMRGETGCLPAAAGQVLNQIHWESLLKIWLTSLQCNFAGWRYPHSDGCWWLGPGVWLPGAKGELIAWQVEPRVMEERGGSFNFCGKCLIETSGACTLGEVLSSTANSPSWWPDEEF